MSATLCASAASAEAAQNNHDEALAEFSAGRALLNEPGGCAKAIPKFQKSIEFEPNIGARLNLAECYAKDSRHVGDAWNQYKQAEQLAIQKNDARVAESRKAEQELDAKVTKIILVLPSDAPDAEVRIDGVAIPRIDIVLLPTGYALDPSVAHRIEVTASGRTPWTKTDINGAAGTSLQAMTVDLGAPAPPAGAEKGGSGQRTLGIIAGGVGIAGLVVGGIFGLVSLGKTSDYNTAVTNKCGGDASHCTGDVRAERQAISGPATIATSGFVAGGVLLATGAVLYFTAPKGTASTSAAKRIYLTPAVGKNDAGFLFGGAL